LYGLDEGGSGGGAMLSDEAPWRGASAGGGGFFTGNPGRYVQIVSRYGHLSP